MVLLGEVGGDEEYAIADAVKVRCDAFDARIMWLYVGI
jgi:hypothetical protein